MKKTATGIAVVFTHTQREKPKETAEGTAIKLVQIALNKIKNGV